MMQEYFKVCNWTIRIIFFKEKWFFNVSLTSLFLDGFYLETFHEQFSRFRVLHRIFLKRFSSASFLVYKALWSCLRPSCFFGPFSCLKEVLCIVEGSQKGSSLACCLRGSCFILLEEQRKNPQGSWIFFFFSSEDLMSMHKYVFPAEASVHSPFFALHILFC